MIIKKNLERVAEGSDMNHGSLILD